MIARLHSCLSYIRCKRDFFIHVFVHIFMVCIGYFITTHNCTARNGQRSNYTVEMTVELLFYFIFFNLPLLLLLLTSVESMSTENKMDSTHNHQESFMCVLFFCCCHCWYSLDTRELVCGNNISYMQF